MALVEARLRTAFTKEHLFESLLTKLNISDSEEKGRIQANLLKALSKRDESGFKEFLVKLAGQAAEKSVAFIVQRIFF